ncbi:hypothetical protein I3760_13G027900 [Carya illinoinensis]|nr:hypothetical protein I3760_13G027900 [Carya illinoinensis]
MKKTARRRMQTHDANTRLHFSQHLSTLHCRQLWVSLSSLPPFLPHVATSTHSPEVISCQLSLSLIVSILGSSYLGFPQPPLLVVSYLLVGFH